MARPLSLNHLLPNTSSSSSHVGDVAFMMSLVALCAFALLMCASHSFKRRRQQWSSFFFGEDDPVIEIQNEVATHHVVRNTTTDQEEQQTEVDSIWQKKILMGGKCELPDFSGVIIYDSNGNLVTPAKNSRPLLLTWK